MRYDWTEKGAYTVTFGDEFVENFVPVLTYSTHAICDQHHYCCRHIIIIIIYFTGTVQQSWNPPDITRLDYKTKRTSPWFPRPNVCVGNRLALFEVTFCLMMSLIKFCRRQYVYDSISIPIYTTVTEVWWNVSFIIRFQEVTSKLSHIRYWFAVKQTKSISLPISGQMSSSHSKIRQIVI